MKSAMQYKISALVVTLRLLYLFFKFYPRLISQLNFSNIFTPCSTCQTTAQTNQILTTQDCWFQMRLTREVCSGSVNTLLGLSSAQAFSCSRMSHSHCFCWTRALCSCLPSASPNLTTQDKRRIVTSVCMALFINRVWNS